MHQKNSIKKCLHTLDPSDSMKEHYKQTKDISMRIKLRSFIIDNVVSVISIRIVSSLGGNVFNKKSSHAYDEKGLQNGPRLEVIPLLLPSRAQITPIRENIC